MKTLRVLHIFPRLEFGGAERLILEYVKHIDRSQIEMAIATTVAGTSMLPLFEEEHIAVCPAMKSRFANARSLMRFVSDFKPDIIHTHLLGGDFFGWYLKAVRKLPVRWIATLHSVEHSTSWARRIVWKYILSKADAVIAVASKVQRYAMESFGISESSIALIPNGIDYEAYASLPVPAFSEKRQIGIIGRLEEGKGHDVLLQALASLRSHDWTLNIFGIGSREPELVALTERFGIADRVRWHGMVADQASMYASLDTVVQPSAREGLSLAVMEAMASGRLVIASPSAAEEIIEDGRTGHVAGTAEEIAEAISCSYEQPAAAERVAASARNHASRFDISHSLKKLEELYSKISAC